MSFNKETFYLCNFSSQVHRLAYFLQDAKIRLKLFFFAITDAENLTWKVKDELQL